MLFDTHAHLDDEQLAGDTEAILDDATSNGVQRILTVSTSLASCYRSIKLAETWESVYAAVGIHPNACHQTNLAQWTEVMAMVDHPRVVAIGETGLDGYWDHCPMDLQKEYFFRHIELSHASGLPFIVHMRDCEAEMMEALASSANADDQLNGVMHSFCGSANAAERCLNWGMHISFAGMVTYKKNDELREVAASVPLDRLLVETDSPYLSPHPCRKQRPNTPSLVRHTLHCLAETRNMSVTDLEQITWGNAIRLFSQVPARRLNQIPDSRTTKLSFIDLHRPTTFLTNRNPA